MGQRVLDTLEPIPGTALLSAEEAKRRPREMSRGSSSGGNAIDATLIFMSLLIGYPDHFGELLLGQAQHNAAFADPPADTAVDRGG